MSFSRWLVVLLRLAGETVVLGVTFHYAHWSVAASLTFITARMEFEALFVRRGNRETDSMRERTRMIERLRDLS